VIDAEKHDFDLVKWHWNDGGREAVFTLTDKVGRRCMFTMLVDEEIEYASGVEITEDGRIGEYDQAFLDELAERALKQWRTYLLIHK
jgi:hypothetical protein